MLILLFSQAGGELASLLGPLAAGAEPWARGNCLRIIIICWSRLVATDVSNISVILGFRIIKEAGINFPTIIRELATQILLMRKYRH